MKAILSTTYDDKYLYFLPIVTWCWNKLGVDVVCFMPTSKDICSIKWLDKEGIAVNFDSKIGLVISTIANSNLRCEVKLFSASEHKEATYAQCSRLYGACLDLSEDEVLITSDVDMGVFGDYLKQFDGNINLFGADLLEGEKMFPMCYCSATVKQWKTMMNIQSETYQEKLDSLLGHIETDHFRGNYWCADQENLYNGILKSGLPITMYPRAKLPERFATRRLDREDSFVMERDVTDIIDFHLPRPGYNHFENIITILSKIYPNENFDWIRTYTEQYKILL